MRKFVIVTRPRSGSNLLCSLLDGFDELICDSELFHPHHIAYSDWPRRFGRQGRLVDDDALRRRDASIEAFLDSRADEVKSMGGISCWGFKHIVEHSRAVVQNLAQRPDFAIIQLVRRNAAAEFISREKAFQTGEWFRKADDAPAHGNLRVEFRVGRYLHFLRRRGRELRFVERAFGTHPSGMLRVTYEDLLDGRGAERAQRFLGIDHARAHEPAVRRQSSGRVLDQVSNRFFTAVALTVLRLSAAERFAQSVWSDRSTLVLRRAGLAG